jgi:hypothetical protein
VFHDSLPFGCGCLFIIASAARDSTLFRLLILLLLQKRYDLAGMLLRTQFQLTSAGYG